MDPDPEPAIDGAGADGAIVVEAGAARNTLLQLGSQLASAIFTAGLTLYLVRALGASTFGVYALAVSFGTLVLFPAGLGLPWSIGRFLADHRGNAREVRAIFTVGMKLQVPAALIAGIGLLAAAGALADAYGQPRLGWPLRWVALSVVGQALFAYLASVGASVRRLSVTLWMTIIESATETATSIGLVLAGSAAAGAALGKAVGYTVAVVLGGYLTVRMLGRPRSQDAGPRLVSVRTIVKYAGAMFVVDVTWVAIAQIDVLLIGALLTSAAVGSFSAVLRVLTVVGYLGTAVAAGVAPRLSLAGGAPDVESFERGLRYLTIVQGLVIAPMLVWAHPIVGLLLGPGYRSSDGIMRVLALYNFIGGPAALLTVAVTYLGEARRRVPIMLGTLVVGLVATYVLLRTVGVLGAAIADDIMLVVYVSSHLWIATRLITLNLRRLALCGIRTLLAAAAMSCALFVAGTGSLSVAGWVLGAVVGLAAYPAVLILTRELSLTEIKGLSASVWSGLHR